MTLTDTERETLAEVLAGHRASIGSNRVRLWSFCRCDPNVELAAYEGEDVPPVGADFYYRAEAAFVGHLAAEILVSPYLAARDARVAATARADALAEAADRMPAFHDRDVPEWAITSACKWLRDRAAALRAATEDPS